MINIQHSEWHKLKDEIPNDTTLEACFLKAKAYCFTTVKGGEEKKLKGINKATVKNQITVEDYTIAVFEGESKYLTNHNNDSNKHHFGTIEQYKIAIDSFDDKVIRGSYGEF